MASPAMRTFEELERLREELSRERELHQEASAGATNPCA